MHLGRGDEEGVEGGNAKIGARRGGGIGRVNIRSGTVPVLLLLLLLLLLFLSSGNTFFRNADSTGALLIDLLSL